jgi:tRNA dimethylallyltransferase
MRPALVVIAGPTASGKSALALALAERLGGEIVSADSQQVYRGLDVGTAKPSPEVRAAVPHHLVDIADPDEQLTAARFVALADAAISEIAARGRVPLVTGGTGLWMRALLRGLADAPPRDEALRERLEAEEAAEGQGHLHRRLEGVDPEAAARLHPNDTVRIIRALEVHALTGAPLSAHHAAHGFEEARYPHRLLALAPERSVLRARIAERVAAMLEAGWIEETRRLLASGAVTADRLRKILGYTEVTAHLEGALAREALPDRIAARTWQYAKRQGLWLRQEPAVERLVPPVDEVALASDLAQWLRGPIARG